MAKRAGRVGFGSGQSGRGSKRVIFKRVNRVTGQTGCGSNGSGQTGLTRFAMSTPGQTASKVTEFLYELVFTFHDSICTWVEEASKGCNEMNISGFSQKKETKICLSLTRENNPHCHYTR